MLRRAFSWHARKKLLGVTFCYQLLQSFFGVLYFCTSLLKNGWFLDSLAVRQKLCLEERRKDRLFLILQYLDGLCSYQWWVQFSDFAFHTSSFCSGLDNNKVIFFWHFLSILAFSICQWQTLAVCHRSCFQQLVLLL